jgi:streptomycin 6-kinase
MADSGTRSGGAPVEVGTSRLPTCLAWLRDSAEGRAWLEALPDLLRECRELWSLHLGEPYQASHVSLVVPASTPGGADVVLKIQFPHRESELEAAALEQWEGDGAVQLLEHDPDRHALLIERCRPGSHLSTLGSENALAVMIDLLPRLWIPTEAPFRPLSLEAARWADQLPWRWEHCGRPFERRLVDAAVGTLETLSATQGEPVLLHQDLHADNVLRAEREPWLAIDPKPLVGEREFGIAPLVRGSELGHARKRVLGRLDRLSGELGLDRERARSWAFAQTLAWAFEGSEVLPRHVETARWLLEAG